jgi:hypothetical protein
VHVCVYARACVYVWERVYVCERKNDPVDNLRRAHAQVRTCSLKLHSDRIMAHVKNATKTEHTHKVHSAPHICAFHEDGAYAQSAQYNL